MVFATSVLLVEGEGDQAFFEGLRRRLAQLDPTGRVDNLYVIHVGSNTSFSQWLKLLQRSTAAPEVNLLSFSWYPMVTPLPKFCEHFEIVGLMFHGEASVKLQEAHQNYSNGNFEQWLDDLRQANEFLLSGNVGNLLCFLEGDLEWAMFSGLSEESFEK